MIWFDATREIQGVTIHGMVNADYVVSITPRSGRKKSTLRTVDQNVWTSDTPYDELRIKLRELKNKGTK